MKHRSGSLSFILAHLTAFGVLSGALASGCSTPLKPTANDLLISKLPGPSPKLLTPSEVKTDITWLLTALEKGSILPFKAEPDLWTATKQSLKRIQAGERARGPLLLCDEIADALWFAGTSHTSAEVDSIQCGHYRRDTPPTSGRNIADDGQQPSSPFKAETRQLAGRKIAIIGVSTFQRPPFGMSFQDIEVLEAIRGADAFVFDLRGNPGGFGPTQYFETRAYTGQDDPLPFARSFTIESPEAYALSANKSFVLKQSPYYGRELADAIKKTALRGMRTAIRTAVRTEGEATNRALLVEALGSKLPIKENLLREVLKGHHEPLQLKGPIRILTDIDCASACEYFLLSLKTWTPERTKQVGTRTAGAMQFVSSGLVVLPYSKIRIELPSLYQDLSPHKIEGIGIPPEIESAPGTDALDVALEDLWQTLAKRK